MENLIIENLYKNFRSKVVLNNINLEIPPGIFGLLGPNGAGKTTLMKCIVSLIDNYKGQIKLGSKKWCKYTGGNGIIGYVPQKFFLFKQLNVYEAMEYIAIAKNIHNCNEEILEILNKVNLISEKDKKVKHLSGGMIRRLGIAQALIGNPKILIIDEPTAGLDPKERVGFRNILLKLPKNIIIIVSTHIVEDLDFIADRIAILNSGNVVISDSVENVLKIVEGKVVTKSIPLQDIYSYESSYKVTSLTKYGNEAVIRIVGDKYPKGSSFSVPTLEDVYFYIIGDEIESSF